MMKIGLTGGIGSGKSVVAKVFNSLGVPVYHADERAKQLMQNEQQIIDQLIRILGKDIYQEGRLNRKKMASIIFSKPDLLKQVNEIVHPFVLKDFEGWAEKQFNKPYVLAEAAILFESGMHKTIDYTIAVAAPEELRITRIMNRDGVSREQVQQRMNNQLPEKEKIKMAGFVIYNDDTQFVLPQVLKIHDELIKKSKIS